MARPDLPTPVASRAPAPPGSPSPIRRHRTTVALLLALGLAASACGSSTADTAADQTVATTAAPATAESDDAPADTNDDTAGAQDGGAAEDAGAEDAGAEDDSGGTVDLANYPNVDVVDLGSGSTVNFAEAVAGGGLPTLIWFWAPH